MNRVLLDWYGNGRVLPEVTAAMAAALEEGGNPSSIHHEGRRARQALEHARRQVAGLLNAAPDEIFFVSCGTEANGWALRGLMGARGRQGRHLIISTIEHPSVALTARRLAQDNCDVDLLPVDAEGTVSVELLRRTLRPDTALVSVMLANGEVGTVEPIRELAAAAHDVGALFHTDAVAAAGHVPIDVRELGVDALSLAADQFGGPSGAAALYVREGTRILPLLDGGGQETGGRSGTEALPAIVGMGIAAEQAARTLPQRADHERRLRDRLRDGLVARLDGARLNGSWSARLPHNLHVCIDGVSSETLVRGLDHAGVSAGLGSACNAKAMRPSAVLKAMGLTDAQANGAMVLTVGHATTDDEINGALEIIPRVAQQLRHVTALTARA